jgi:hypothetical protein
VIALRAGWCWLAEQPHHRTGLRLLQGALGAALLLHVCTELPFVAYLWGPGGLGWGSTQPVLGPTLGRLIDLLFVSELGTLAVVVALAAGALGLLFGYRTDVAILLALVAFALLEQRLPELIDRGDTLARLVLCYGLFALPVGAQARRGSLPVWLHNVAVLAITLQVVVLYGSSGLWKASGDQWQHGTALYYVSQADSLSLPALRELFKQPWITTLLTYGSMFYELLFPVALVSRLKLPWLVFGALFHVGIAVVLGLVTFSLVMLGLLAFLVSDAEYARLRAWWRTARAWHGGRERPAVLAPTPRQRD